jgi:hypothetical protein
MTKGTIDLPRNNEQQATAPAKQIESVEHRDNC